MEKGILREDIRVGEIKTYEHKPTRIPDILERDVVGRILDNPNTLKEALGIANMGSLIPEMPTEGDERVDIMTQELDEICFPIEVKLGIGDHRIVGQIKKYVDFFWRRLSYGFYHTVQGATIAAGYDQNTMKELKAMGTWVYAYEWKDSGISLLRL